LLSIRALRGWTKCFTTYSSAPRALLTRWVRRRRIYRTLGSVRRGRARRMVETVEQAILTAARCCQYICKHP
jgi:hypothetical protein